MAGLGALDGGIFGSEALAASGDGSVIVGQDFIATKQTQAFLWTSSLGMVSLRDYLIAHGADLTGWSLASASGISADARSSAPALIRKARPKPGSPRFQSPLR